MNKDMRWYAARAYPFLVAVPFLLTAWVPASLNAGVVTAGGLLLGGGLCVVAVLQSPRTLPRSVAVAIAMSLTTAVWFFLASRWAANPAVSLFAPHGAAAWALTSVWLCAGVALADGRALKETIAAISAAGAFFALATTYEALTHGTTRTQGYAAGFFENSTSAGEIFALAVLTAVVGALIARSRSGRVGFAAAGIMSALGLALSSSRTAALGLALAFIFAICVARFAGGARTTRLLALAPPLGALLLTTTAVLTSYGTLGGMASDLVAKVGTDRDAIWRSAWAQFAQSPVIGKGLAQFSALIQWGGLATGQLQFNATSDPHNTLLGAAIGGGVVGLALALLTVTTLLNALVSIARKNRTSYSAVLLASTPVLLLGMGLVGWVSAATLLAAAALLGAALGSAASKHAAQVDEPPVGPAVIRPVGFTVGALALVLGLAFAQPLAVEYTYSRSLLSDATRLSSTDAESLYRRFPLPGIGTDALKAVLPEAASGSSPARQRAKALIDLTEPDATRDASVALYNLRAAQTLTGKDPAGFALFERMVRAGQEADPASGLWYAFAAAEAKRLGLSQEAQAYAHKALEYPQDESTRALLMSIR